MAQRNGSKTPLPPPERLALSGYTIAVCPLTLLDVSIQAMRRAITDSRTGRRAAEAMEFDALKAAVGFPAYEAEEARYRTP